MGFSRNTVTEGKRSAIRLHGQAVIASTGDRQSVAEPCRRGGRTCGRSFRIIVMLSPNDDARIGLQSLAVSVTARNRDDFVQSQGNGGLPPPIVAPSHHCSVRLNCEAM